MKPETMIAVWATVLFACVLGTLGSLIHWPTSLREPWHPGDWAAWVQAVGSIVALAISVAIAYQARVDANRRDSAAVQQQEGELGVLLGFFKRSVQEAVSAARDDSFEGVERVGQVLDALVRRAGLMQTSLVPAKAAWQFLEGVRIATHCQVILQGRVLQEYNPDAPREADRASKLSVHATGLDTVIEAYEMAIGRKLSWLH